MLATIVGTASAQSPDIQGEISFKGGETIPAGQIGISLEDLSIQDRALRRVAETRIDSDGGSRVIAFALSLPAGTAAPALQVVARLERADGWLIARGSVRIDAGAPVRVTLREAIY